MVRVFIYSTSGVNNIIGYRSIEIAFDILDILGYRLTNKRKKEILEYIIYESFILNLGKDNHMNKIAVFSKNLGCRIYIISALTCVWQRHFGSAPQKGLQNHKKGTLQQISNQHLPILLRHHYTKNNL